MDLIAESTALLAVIEAGSLLAGSRRLGRSVSSVSRGLDALEKHVGATLLLRSTRGVRLTSEGEAFRTHAEAMLDAAQSALASVRPGEPEGVLTVSASTALGLTWVNPHLFSFMKQWPRVRVGVRLEDRLIDVVGEGVDVAVRAGAAPADQDRLIASKLGVLQRVLVAAPDYPAIHTPEALHRVDLITSNRDGNTTWTLRRGTENIRIERPARLWATGLLAVRDAVRAGVGIAILSEMIARDDLARGDLVRVLPDWEATPAPVWVIYRRELRRSRLVTAFVRHLLSSNLESI